MAGLDNMFGLLGLINILLYFAINQHYKAKYNLQSAYLLISTLLVNQYGDRLLMMLLTEAGWKSSRSR